MKFWQSILLCFHAMNIVKQEMTEILCLYLSCCIIFYFLYYLEVSTILYFSSFVLSWNFHNFIFTNFNTTLFWENYIILLLKSSVNYEKNCLQKKSQLTFKTMEYTLLLCLNILQAQNKISSVWFYLKYFSSYFHAFFKFYKYF